MIFGEDKAPIAAAAKQKLIACNWILIVGLWCIPSHGVHTLLLPTEARVLGWPMEDPEWLERVKGALANKVAADVGNLIAIALSICWGHHDKQAILTKLMEMKNKFYYFVTVFMWVLKHLESNL